MTDKTIKLDLSQIGDGGLQEKVDKELEKVIANILDPNTETKTARKLVITINQTTTVKSGVASLAKATAPNPVTLRPYRTFTEVAQPSSQFVLRINKEAELALFEADGGKWKLEAIKNIADYLKAGLEDQDNITILA